MKFAMMTAIACLVISPVLRADCDAEKPVTCTVQQYREALDKNLRTDLAMDATEKKVGNQNRATTAPDAFAARLHNSYQDFIAPLSFAINKVEESQDGRALIVRLNPIREKQIKAGITVTAAKPVLFKGIADNIPEAQRDSATTSLEKKLKDFDDVTIAGSLAFDSPSCDDLGKICFGRNPKTYRKAIEKELTALASNAASIADSPEAQKLESKLVNSLPNKDEDALIGSIQDAKAQNDVINMVKKLVQLDFASSKKALEFLDKAGINNLATLLDNQPQLSATGSYRNVGSLGGPDEVAATFEFQMGLYNLHAAAKDGLTATLPKDPAQLPTDKFVISASYKRTTHYALDSMTGTGVTVTGFTPIDLPRTSALVAKGQWGRKIVMFTDKDQQPRLDVSAEFERNGKGGIRTKNRLVATATLTIPFSEQMSLPFSLKYANKSEFLDDVREKTSVHFGISYRLPWEPRAQ